MSTVGPNRKAIDPTVKILVVDDSTQFSMILNRLLSSVFGFESITSLTTTADALERIIALPDEFGLLFLDFHFPQGINGGELLKELAERGLTKNKIIFLMSSDPTAESLQQVLKAGAAGVIAKPFDRDELGRQLERAARFLPGDDGAFSF